MVASQDIIGVKMPVDQKSEGILFYQLQPFIVQTSYKGFYISKVFKLLTVQNPKPSMLLFDSEIPNKT